MQVFRKYTGSFTLLYFIDFMNKKILNFNKISQYTY